MNGPTPRTGTVGPIYGGVQDNRTYTHDGQGTTFVFRKRWGQINWRSLASVDVDRIARDMDFQSLQQNMMNVTFCNIESEEFHNVDQNFLKLFKLSQLIIEYLLHCQQYLSEQGSNLEQRIQELQAELENARTELSSQTAELKTVKKDNKKRKKIIQAYQDMLNAGATGVHACPVCSREFVSKEYLQSHIHRRHPDHLPLNERDSDRKKLLSQEELEKRLVDQMTERLHTTETQLKEEMQRKELESLEKHEKEFELWKTKEQEKMKVELHEFKEPILTELRAVQQEKAELEEALLQKRAEVDALSAKKQSHLGHLEGAQELDIDGSKKTSVEIEQLKEQLEVKVHEMQSSMKKQEKSWQKRMQKLSTSYQDQIKDSKEQLHSLEQSLLESSQGKENDKFQSSLTSQLSSLKKKMKVQEKQLHSQEQQLTVLQARDYSPSPPPPLRVSEHPPQEHAARVQVRQQHSESDESVLETEDTEDSDQDDIDSPPFHTPLPHRPTIKTTFDHAPEVLEDIKRETKSILSDALLQRGFPKNMRGLSSNDFIAKMKTLEQERQQRVQTHFNFQDHRDRLVREVEDIAQSEFVFEPPKDGLPRVKQSHNNKTKKGSSTAQSTDLALSLPGTSRNKPPKPTSSRLSTAQPVNSGGTPSHKPPTTSPDHSLANGRGSTSAVTPASRVEAADSSESSEEVSENEEDFLSDASLSSLTATPPVSRHNTPPPDPLPNTTTNVQTIHSNQQNDDDDSPWDSDHDSIEVLAAPQAGGRTSSTPIKGGGHNRNLVQIPSSQASVINIEPNPLRRPPGGVPLFQVTPANPPQDDDDSFDISEPSLPAAPTTVPTSNRNNLKSSLRFADETQTIPPISHTATSRSALTTVSIDDFVDSDFSDLDL